MKRNHLAKHAIEFIENLIVPGSNPARLFKLLRWQRDFLKQLLVTDEDGRLIVQRAMLFLPKKQGKSTLISSLLLFFLLYIGRDREHYSAAADRKQAAIIFKQMRRMIEADPELKRLFEITPSQKHIKCIATGNEYEACSSEAGTKHGMEPSFVVIDEISMQPNRELMESLTLGMSTVESPLVVIVGHAGEDRSGLAREELDYAHKVRDGIVDDPSYLSVLYQAGDDEDWTEEKTWRKCMPSLGRFCSLKYIQQKCDKAKVNPAEEWAFKTYYLNQFLGANKSWMPISYWDSCKREINLQDLYGKQATIGLDLSVSTDWSAAVIAVPLDDLIYILPYFWIPLNVANRRELQDPQLWRSWEKRKLLNIVEGDVLDHQAIADQIHELAKNFKVDSIQIDRAYANNGALRLRDVHGYNVEFYNQGLLSICGPTVALETAIRSKKIVHDGNPVLKWMMSNAKTTTPDKNGNYQLSKGKSSDKIDGVIAMLMAFDRSRQPSVKKSVYESRGIIYI